MPRIAVPERHREALRGLVHLDEVTLGRVLDALRQAKSASPNDLAAAFDQKLPLEISDQRLFEAIQSLYVARQGFGSSVDEFAQGVARSLRSTTKEDLGTVEEVQGVIRKVLSVESFARAAKTADLLTDDERDFCGAKIVTDLRPIFGTTVEDGAEGMALIHVLRIGFHLSGEHQNFFVALSTHELGSLKAHIERAEAKAKSLRAQLQTWGVEYLGEDDQNGS